MGLRDKTGTVCMGTVVKERNQGREEMYGAQQSCEKKEEASW